MDKILTGSEVDVDLNVSSFPDGSYFIVLKGEQFYHSQVFNIARF